MANNEHLVEVLCAIRFDPIQNQWDSTFFGKYHELIEKRGYTDKKEQKQVEFHLEVNPAQTPYTVKEGQSQTKMVFSNPILKSAIIMMDNFISFHKLAPYVNWDQLVKDIVQPGLEEYRQIGLGKGVIEVQCLYLNKYKMEIGDTVSKYFNFLPVIENSMEAQVSFQGKYNLDSSNVVQLKLNTTANPTNYNFREAFFECSGFALSNSYTEDYIILAQRAHDNANHAYNAIIKR